MAFEPAKSGRVRLVLAGRLDTPGVARVWRSTMKELASARPSALDVDASQIDYCDGAGIGLLLELRHRQERAGASISIQGLKPEFMQLLAMFDPGQPPAIKRQRRSAGALVEAVGAATTGGAGVLTAYIRFTGELFARLLSTAVRPWSLRWKDTLLIAEKTGANGVAITALLGFLIGLILAFQSAISLRRFAAEIFVADLVVISLFRELGPLITAFVVASRSGSAFAAEIGTMKINEEIDALTTMGIDPVRFLVVPRVVAGVFVMPLLTVFNILFGIIGCGIVMAWLGFPFVTFVQQVEGAADLSDLFGGLAKTFVFGLLIAAIGCLKGLQTGSSASAVGDSATRAVVAGIVAIVIADGLFAVLYFVLGI